MGFIERRMETKASARPADYKMQLINDYSENPVHGFWISLPAQSFRWADRAYLSRVVDTTSRRVAGAV